MRHRVRASVHAIFLFVNVLLFLWVIRARTRPTLLTVGEWHLSLHLNMYIYICIYVYTTSTSTSTSTIVQQVLNMRPAIFFHDTTSPYRFLLLVSLKVRPQAVLPSIEVGLLTIGPTCYKSKKNTLTSGPLKEVYFSPSNVS